MLRPPSTDSGVMKNMKWSFADSHMRIEEGEWARETTVRELPTSVELAGVNMRLEEGVIRELHWHKEVLPPHIRIWGKELMDEVTRRSGHTCSRAKHA